MSDLVALLNSIKENQQPAPQPVQQLSFQSTLVGEKKQDNGVSYHEYLKTAKLWPLPNSLARSARKGFNATGLIREIENDGKFFWLCTTEKTRPATYEEVKQLFWMGEFDSTEICFIIDRKESVAQVTSKPAVELLERCQSKFDQYRQSRIRLKSTSICPAKFVYNRFLSSEKGRACLQNSGNVPNYFFGPDGSNPDSQQDYFGQGYDWVQHFAKGGDKTPGLNLPLDTAENDVFALLGMPRPTPTVEKQQDPLSSALAALLPKSEEKPPVNQNQLGFLAALLPKPEEKPPVNQNQLGLLYRLLAPAPQPIKMQPPPPPTNVQPTQVDLVQKILALNKAQSSTQQPTSSTATPRPPHVDLLKALQPNGPIPTPESFKRKTPAEELIETLLKRQRN